MIHLVSTGKCNKVFVCIVQLLLECARSKVFQLLTEHHPESCFQIKLDLIHTPKAQQKTEQGGKY